MCWYLLGLHYLIRIDRGVGYKCVRISNWSKLAWMEGAVREVRIMTSDQARLPINGPFYMLNTGRVLCAAASLCGAEVAWGRGPFCE